MPLPVILADRLTKTYGSSNAVRDVTFSVAKGECLGLLGPNGAGKTTIIHLIAGLLEPTAGRVHIAGVPLDMRPLQARAHIGLVPQDFALYPTLSATENLVFFGRLYGLWGKRLAERMRHALAAVHLDGCAEAAVSTYSGGMKRRLNLAVGLLHDPEVLILDEPTVGIDAESRHSILDELKALVQSGKSILLCTHDFREAESLCVRAAIMDAGRIVALDTPPRLIQQHGTGLIRVEFEPPVDDRILQELRRMGAARRPSDRTVGFQIRSGEPNAALERLLKMARECGAAMRSAELLDPTLETVFLNLTGRSMSE